MADMGNMPGMDMGSLMDDMPDMDMSSGWAKAGTPEGHKALSYDDLRSLGTQAKAGEPDKELEVRALKEIARGNW